MLRNEPATAIIPAYNEEKYIGSVLEAFSDLDEVSQILVIDDGSTDSTRSIVSDFVERDPRIELIALASNQGKAGAMLEGISRREHDLLITLDADLMNLSPENLRELCEPVRRGYALMTLGLFRGGRRQTDWSHALTPFLSGQRCLRWSYFRQTPELRSSRWGIETALSLHAWQQGYPVERVIWSGVTHAMRPEKLSLLGGCLSHLNMWFDISRYLGKNLLRIQWQHIVNSSRRRRRRDARSILQREV